MGSLLLSNMLVVKIIGIVLLFTVIGINTFATDQCEHEELITAVADFDKCLENFGSDSDGEYNHCTPFEEGRECVDGHLGGCFVEEDLARIVQNTLGKIRNVSTQFLLNPDVQESQGFVLSEAEVDVVYSTCKNIPDKTFAQNIENQKLIILEEGVTTDNNCTKAEVKEVNNEINQCWIVEMKKAKAEIRNFSHRGSIQAMICSIMDKTLGKCFRKPYSPCFSEREKSYLKSELADIFKDLFEAIEDLLPSSKHGVSISSCSVFSSSEKKNQPSHLVHIMFVIFSLYV